MTLRLHLFRAALGLALLAGLASAAARAPAVADNPRAAVASSQRRLTLDPRSIAAPHALHAPVATAC